ncbi:MAG: EAL domain-containing protein, partial [Pseudomonadota bacterium]
AGLDQNPENCHFLENLCELAHAFNVQVAAEWVEDVNTATKLDDWGFDFLQGKLYGMPLATAPWRKVSSNKADQQKSTAV